MAANSGINYSSFGQKLQDWIVNESDFLIDGRLITIPDLDVLKILTSTRNMREMWTHIIEHCRSRRNVRRIRQILAAKREIDFDLSPSIFEQKEDMEVIQLEVSKAVERQHYQKSSLDAIQERIASVEAETQNYRANIDKVNQKTALLDLLLKQYETNINFVSSHCDELSNLLIKMEQTDAEDNHVINSNMKFNINCQLSEISSALSKKKEGSEVRDLMKRFKDIIYCKIPTKKLLVLFREFCKSSQLQMVQELSTDVPLKVIVLEHSSLKWFHALKVEQIQKHFSFEALQKETDMILTMCNSKNTSVKTRMLKFPCETVEERLKYINGVGELEGLRKNIMFLTESLDKMQIDTVFLAEENHQQKLILPDVEIIEQRFLHSFNRLYALYKSSLNIQETFRKHLIDLHTLIDENLFCDWTIRDQSSQLKTDLGSELQMVWRLLDQKKILNHPLSYILSEETYLDQIRAEVGVSTYQNARTIIYKLANLIEQKAAKTTDCEHFSLNQDDEIINSCCENIYNYSEKMSSTIQECQAIIDQAMKVESDLYVAFKDWKEQNAQFILDITYKGRSLKMWLDMLKLLPDIIL